MHNLLKLIEINDYRCVLLKIKNKIKINVKEEIHSIYLNKFDESMVKAKISFEDIILLLETNSELEKISNYVVKKLIKYDGCNEQEYPDGEEPDEDEKDIIISDDGYSVAFLAFHLIEYCVLKQNKNEIDNYVKAIRIPNAKKYSKEVTEIFDEVNI